MSEDLAAASAAVGEAGTQRCAGNDYCSAVDHEHDSATADVDVDIDGKITIHQGVVYFIFNVSTDLSLIHI